MKRQLGNGLAVLGWVLFAVGTVRGEYFALTGFFRVQMCPDTGCVWLFHSWSPVAWGLLFVLVYLPLSPIVAAWASAIYLVPAGLLLWSAGKLRGATKPQREYLRTSVRSASWGSRLLLWCWWVLGSSVGAVLGLVLGVGAGMGLALGLRFVGASPPAMMAGAWVSIVIGAYGVGPGVGQWLVLRRRISAAGWWIPATIGVTVIGLVIGEVVSMSVPQIPAASAALVTVALTIGVGQWLVLRRNVARAGWWIPAATLGLLAGGPVGRLIGEPVGRSLGAGGTGGLAAAVMVGATVSGVVLVWLLQLSANQSAPTPPRQLLDVE